MSRSLALIGDEQNERLYFTLSSSAGYTPRNVNKPYAESLFDSPNATTDRIEEHDIDEGKGPKPASSPATETAENDLLCALGALAGLAAQKKREEVIEGIQGLQEEQEENEHFVETPVKASKMKAEQAHTFDLWERLHMYLSKARVLRRKVHVFTRNLLCMIF